MENEFIARKEITIRASAAKVWDGLTNPDLIKQYFFGTEAVSDWKAGSSIVFRGVWEGKPYEDKGTILAIENGKYLKYNYWSSFSGTADIPENYANVAYELNGGKDSTTVVITQDHCKDEASRDHSAQNWGIILEGMKKLLEQ